MSHLRRSALQLPQNQAPASAPTSNPVGDQAAAAQAESLRSAMVSVAERSLGPSLDVAPAGAPGGAPVAQFKTKRGMSSAQAQSAEVQRAVESTASGNALPADVRQSMEQAFNADFSGVRIHESQRPAEFGAAAYAQQNDIHFVPGHFNPGSASGRQLLGHELTHVVQQRQGRVQPTSQRGGLSINTDSALEAEADKMGARAAAGQQVRAGAGPVAHQATSRAALAPLQMGGAHSTGRGGGDAAEPRAGSFCHGFSPGPTTGFSGVYDPTGGTILVYPSGDALLANGEAPPNLVARLGGHAAVNAAMVGTGVDGGQTTGFVVLYPTAGQLEMRWNSGSVNMRNHGQRAAPAAHRPPITALVEAETGLTVV